MSSQYDDLEKLAVISRNKGIITEEEFNLKKAQILNSDSKTTNTKPSQQEKDQHPQSSNNMMGTLVIIRPSAYKGSLISVKVNINGLKMGEVKKWGNYFSFVTGRPTPIICYNKVNACYFRFFFDKYHRRTNHEV